MGVPHLFQLILEKFPKSHQKVENQDIDYLFLDYNSIIYEAYENVKKDLLLSADSQSKSKKKIPYQKIEKKIIQAMIDLTDNMIRNVVKPKKLVYFAIDGTPPRGKMVEQRARRYKRPYEDEVKSLIQEKYKQSETKEPWSTTSITPGTEFMEDVTKALHQAIMDNTFPSNLEYVLSDVHVPGEGEHKFLPLIDSMPSKSKLAIYSNDGDMIMIMLRFPQHYVYLLTKPRDTGNKVLKKYKDESYLYLVIEGIDEGFQYLFMNRLQENNNQNQTHNQNQNQNQNQTEKPPISMRELKQDFMFFGMLGGNDFVTPIYFLKMRDNHSFNVLKGVYLALLKFHKKPLIQMKKKEVSINYVFFTDYMKMIAAQEVKWLREKQEKFKNIDYKSHAEKDTPEWEKEWLTFQHSPFYKRDHPLYEKYKEEFNSIDYTLQPHKLWKEQYYQKFFQTSYQTDHKMNKKINYICKEYIKSIAYTIQYYLDHVPSWKWYYPYHASPLPSDIYHTLNRMSPKDFYKLTHDFPIDEPYTPLEQLILILPPQSKLLPQKFHQKVIKPLHYFFPTKFEINALWGEKFIYSNPILPHQNDKKILDLFNKVSLTEDEKQRNLNHIYPLFYPQK